MKLSFTSITLISVLKLSDLSVDAKSMRLNDERGLHKKKGIPEIGYLIDTAFPMWEVDGDGNRVSEGDECTPKSCKWNPYYLTKRYDGLHPDLGGHPTDIDVKYAFYYASPFGGQSGGGSPHHCPEDEMGGSVQKCPKVVTLSDNGSYGPGHVPPHIALASLTWATEEELVPIKYMFNYDLHGCRVIPDILLQMIRHYYPREAEEAVDYPPPFTPEGGDYQLEFPSGRGIDNQGPPYEPGPPHWCTQEFLDAEYWPDFCPYVFQGPDAGKYRHPHIAYAALEVYLANIALPQKCATTWLENNPDFLDSDRVATNIAFPKMDADDEEADTVANWLGQPVLPLEYDSSTEKKAAAGTFVNQYLYGS